MKKKRGKEGINKWWLVFHELCISKAVLYTHIHQLATREGIGQQCTSNTEGTELGVGGGKAQHLENCSMWYLYCSWVSKWVKKENRKLQELSNITHRWRFMRTFYRTSSFWLLLTNSCFSHRPPSHYTTSVWTFVSRAFTFFRMSPYHFHWWA